MKKAFLIFTILLLAINFCYAEETKTKLDSTKQNAIKATNLWITLIDEVKYGESWEHAASIFRNSVTKENWEKALNTLLPPLGKVIKRELVSAKYLTSIPGAPDGEYVVITYKTKFTNKSKAVETITPMKDGDGVWRISGYFIK